MVNIAPPHQFPSVQVWWCCHCARHHAWWFWCSSEGASWLADRKQTLLEPVKMMINGHRQHVMSYRHHTFLVRTQHSHHTFTRASEIALDTTDLEKNHSRWNQNELAPLARQQGSQGDDLHSSYQHTSQPKWNFLGKFLSLHCDFKAVSEVNVNYFP